MKILFLIPPPLDSKPAAERIFGCNYGIYNQPNIFILYAVSYLKNMGLNPDFEDYSIKKNGQKNFEEFSVSQNYDLIVFYSVFLSSKTDIMAREIISRKNLRTKFAFLSTEPTASPEKFVREDSYVVRGEPEITLYRLIDALITGKDFALIRGLTFHRNGKVISSPQADLIENLDLLPFPDRSILDKSVYYNPKFSVFPVTTVLTSRGCSYRCRFCIPNSLCFSREIEYKRFNNKKPPVLRRSNKNIIEEMLILRQEGYKAVTFLDDQFVWDENETIELCRLIEPLGFQWTCLVRADRLQNTEMLLAMAKAGCISIDIGVESFDDKILADIRKDCKRTTIHSAIQKVLQAGIEPKLNILIGASEFETEETINSTFNEIKKYNVDIVMFSICTPFPHTEFNRIAKERGWMIAEEYEGIAPMRESFISYPALSAKKLESIVRKLYRKYYFRPSYILKRLRQLTSVSEFIEKVKVATKIFLTR